MIKEKAESLCLDIIARAKAMKKFEAENGDIVEEASVLYDLIQKEKGPFLRKGEEECKSQTKRAYPALLWIWPRKNILKKKMSTG